ncbi:MAG: glycosyltransferase [Candidatus Neomarinimicrobiota bacterium]|jgi:cellulose synthase/poly-beta-1,6-N-acetylglucosamine synthase-like glycosyltransferase|nr:glycosyltransferase [Candidatus Neomarinimicrobiota bacterium]MDD3966706.1 glycosyltransferase [Candidatus Neomarinimicrobiota bacterium]MDX9780291.1 glycosyltransferase [bacterium]
MSLSLNIIIAVCYALAGCYVLYILYFLLGFRRLKAHALKKDADLPALSVLICARNEEASVEACIRSVFAQDYPSEKFSVVAVNDRSEDATPQILEKLSQEFSRLHVLHLDSCPPGVSPKKHAISRGLEYCDTEFIVATDADALHQPQWLRSYGSICNEKLGAATGLSIFRKETYRSGWERSWQSMQTLEALSHNVVIAGAMAHGFAITANGNNMMYRKSLFNGDTVLKNHVVTGDDSDIVYESQRRGYDVLFNAHPVSVVRLKPESGVGAVINQRVRWASHVMKATLPVRILGLSVFFFYLSTILLPFLAFADPFVLNCWAGLVLIKAACDFAYMSFTLHKFRIPYRFGHLFLMELVHALFIVWVGLAGTFGRFTWKGTEYKKTMKL